MAVRLGSATKMPAPGRTGGAMVSSMDAEAVTIPIPGQGAVSGLWQAPDRPSACLVLAHGAGAGMTHRSMAASADGLAGRGVATLLYHFPCTERRPRRGDPPCAPP